MFDIVGAGPAEIWAQMQRQQQAGAQAMQGGLGQMVNNPFAPNQPSPPASSAPDNTLLLLTEDEGE